MPTTGQLIRAAREAAGLSQTQLSKRLQGVSHFLISHWEADRRPVTDMEALADALGTTAEALTGDENPAPRKKAAPIGTGLVVPEVEGYLNITQAQRLIQQLLGQKVYHYSLHAWVQGRGLPAYENALKKNPHGEPTLLFKRSEIEAWLKNQVTPLRAVNQ